MTNTDPELRQQLTNMLTVMQAHMHFEEAIANFPIDQINTRIPNAEYTFWHLIEHIRICQIDILRYIHGVDYVELKFPDDLWPARDAVTDEAGWQQAVDQFLVDRQALVDIINDPANDLHAQLPHAAEGHTILREVLIVGSHNAYHIGELGALRQAMKLW
ncbi:MAG: DinB family protein [Chloroflexota bacterium]